jgi:DNA-binding transcriptional regulator WhiA
MTTLKVTIDSKKNAKLLTKVLQNMKFVKKIEEEDNVVVKQYESLNELFDGIGQGDIFNEINEPVEWQKKIRNEW